jgi:hypothetical protein
MNFPDDTSPYTVCEKGRATAKRRDAASASHVHQHGVKSLRFVLILFMGAFAMAAGVAAFHLAVGLLHNSTEMRTGAPHPVRALVGRAVACGVFSWFAFALWQKNRIGSAITCK